MATNTFTVLMKNIGPAIQPTLREVGGLYRFANTDFSLEARAPGDTIDAVFAAPLTAVNISPSPSGTNAQVVTPVRTQLVLNNWQEARFQLNSKEEQEISNKPEYFIQQMNQAIRAVANAMETTFFQAAVSGAASTVNGGHGLSSSLSVIATARKALTDNLAPQDGRAFIYSPAVQLDLLNNANFVQVQQAGSAETLRTGIMLPVLGFNMVESNLIPTFSTSGSACVALQKAGLGIAVRPASVNSNAVILIDETSGIPYTVSRWEQEYQTKYSVGALWGVKAIFTGSLVNVLAS